MIFSRISLSHRGKWPVLKGWVFLLVGVATGYSKDDPVALLQRHRYEEAVAVWNQDLQASRVGETALRSLKGQGIAYFRLGSLYQNLQGFSLAIMQDYYAQLAETSATPLVYLYLGEIETALGNTAKAKAWLEMAKQSGPTAVQEMASVYLQFAAGAQATPVKSVDAQWQALDLKQANLAASNGLAASSARARRCRLNLLARESRPDREALEKAVAAVVRDGQDPEVIQDVGKNTQINFYDPELMGSLARGYFALSKAISLELLAQESKNPELAAKFKTPLALAESALRLGQMEEALRYLGKDGSSDAVLLRVRVLARTKKNKEAQELLDGLTSQAGRNAALKRDIAEAYYLSGLNPDKGLQLIEQALKDKNGPTYYRVQAGLLMAKGDKDAAVQQYAKGYKIEFRNRIDQIDPEYMADYSFAIYQNNKLRYEEIVETLYHLQKEFPPSRQMHYCMQGVSAGLARSFDAQRIFRKGG